MTGTEQLSNLGRTPMDFKDCRSVADLIDFYLWVRGHRPQNGKYGQHLAPGELSGNMTRHLALETEIALKIREAELDYKKPFIWAGEIWWTQNRPREGILNHVPVLRADEAKWPLPPKEPERKGPPPEKEAGFISSQHA